MKKLFVSSLAGLMLLAGCQQPPVQPTPPTPTEQETQPTTETETENEMPGGRLMRLEGDFHHDETSDDYFGTLYLEGSAKVIQMNEGFCDENCKKFDYVFFQFTPEFDADNEAFQAFMKMNDGNSFAGANSLSIGCSEEHGIRRTYLTGSTEGEATIAQTDSETILKSSAEAPILMKLTRPGPVPGRGAPDCYSHFSEVELVTIAPNV